MDKSTYDKCPECQGQKRKVSIVCSRCNKRRLSEQRERAQKLCRCGKPIYRDNVSGTCRKCREATVTASAARVATGTQNVEDALRFDNVRLRDEHAKMRAALEKAAASKSLESALLETFTETLRRNPYHSVFDPPPLSEKSGTAQAHEMVGLVSDAHFPEVVDPEVCFGIKYDPQICRARMNYIRDKTIVWKRIREAAYPIRKLTVPVIGDMLGGIIHDELEVTNDLTMSQSLVDMAYMLYEMGLSYAREFPEVEMIVMPGNHPRLTKKPRFKEVWNNWEWVMGQFVAALARGQFKVVTPKDLIYRHQVFDFWVGLTHGDGVQAQSFMGIPFYSLDKRRHAFQQLLRTYGIPQVDYLFYGHFHRMIYDDDLGFLINGSIKGGDEYSIKKFYRATPPVQVLLTFHPKHGLTDFSRINLKDVV